jgi:hypothetical protein
MRKLVLMLVCAATCLGAAAPSVLAASEPVASTGNAAAITPSSATLNGTVNPEGQSTSYHFEYGTTTSYGGETAIADAGAGTAMSRSRMRSPTVTLESSPAAGGPWTDTRSTTAASSGLYSFPALAPSANTYYRVLSDGATSAALLVRVNFRISLLVSRSRPPAGSPVRFHGYAAPGHRWHLVLVQREGPFGRWYTIAVTRLRRFGFYSVKVRIRRRGHFRTVVVPDAGHGVGRSRAVLIRVR